MTPTNSATPAIARRNGSSGSTTPTSQAPISRMRSARVASSVCRRWFRGCRKYRPMPGTYRPHITEKCQAENSTSSTATQPRSRPRRVLSSSTSSTSAPTKGPKLLALVGRERIARSHFVGEVRQAEALHAPVSDVRDERMRRCERLFLRQHGARVKEDVEEFRARRSGEHVDDLILCQH